MKRGARIDQYEVLDRLGEGGMGTVYRVRHTGLEVERALKLLLRTDPKQRERFEREVLRLAQVRHPNVVGIHGAGVAPDGRPYFVMDLLDGRTLDQVLEEDGAPGFEQAVEWMITICAGVQALHEQGVVHRDLKPQNVLVTRDGRPVVLDVGLAVDPERDDRLTREGAIVGTLHYMAPEQFGRGAISTRTDVYSLGLILFEVLTGVPAVTASGSAELLGQILNRATPAPSSSDPNLPRAVDRVVAIATAREPEERFPDAEALGQALQELLVRPGASRRVQRAMLGGALALAVCALLVALVMSARSFEGGGSKPEGAKLEADAPGVGLERIRGLVASEARVKAAQGWLARHADDPARGEAEAILAGALDRWGRERLKQLRAPQTPAELYVAVQDWRATFGPAHKNAEVVTSLLAAAARKGPIKRFGPAWFAVHMPDGQALSAYHDGVRRWDLRRLRPLGEAWKVSAWVGVPDPDRRGFLTLQAGGPRSLSWYDLARGEQRPFVKMPYAFQQVRFSPRGTVATLRGVERFQVRSVPGGELHYRHQGPAEVRDALPDDAGHVAIVYWGTLGDRVKPPPILDVRRMKDDALLARHKLIGSGYALDLAQDGRTLAVGTGLGRVYLFDMRDPTVKRVLVGRDLTDPQRGVTDPIGMRGFATCVRFSPNGETLFVVGTSHDLKAGELRAWDVKSGEQVWDRLLDRPARFVDVAPDGRSVLVTGDPGQPFELWLWRP